MKLFTIHYSYSRVNNSVDCGFIEKTVNRIVQADSEKEAYEKLEKYHSDRNEKVSDYSYITEGI